MPQTIKYTGTTQRWPELAYTGKQSVWTPGQMEERSGAECAQLLASGLFALVSNQVATVATDPFTGGIVGLNSGGVTADVAFNSVGLAYAPSDVFALASNASAVVQWVAPNFSTPDSYTVTSSGGQSVTVAASSRTGSATVTGLTNGVAYTFTVTANTSPGASVASLASNSVTPSILPSQILPVTRGLQFWFSAKNLPSPPSNLAAVTQLADLSGNGNNAPGTGNWLTSWSSGQPSVTLNGSSNYFTIPIVSGRAGPLMTAYFVLDATASAQGRVISSENGGSTPLVSYAGLQFALVIDTGTIPTIYDAATGSGSSLQSAGTTIGASPATIVLMAPGGFRINGAYIANSKLGALMDSRKSQSLLTGQAAPANTLAIGCENGGNFGKYLTGHIAEVIIFVAQHTSAEIALMETYLNTLK